MEVASNSAQSSNHISNEDVVKKYSIRRPVIITAFVVTFVIIVAIAVVIYMYQTEKLYVTVSHRRETKVTDQCRLTNEAPEYTGTLSVTGKGFTCMKWGDVPDEFRYPWLDNQENYCRNPSSVTEREPFCFVEKPGSFFGFEFQCCHIPLCSKNELLRNCKNTTKGENYLGYINVTINGRICQKWSDLYPHNHTYTNMSEHGNYCRNPNSHRGPWCFTTDENKRWEECLIPYCGYILDIEDCIRVKGDGTFATKGKYYAGYINKTISGKTCMKWTDAVRAGKTDGYECDLENYCRNTYEDHDQPWCYTTDPDVEWEICDIPACE